MQTSDKQAIFDELHKLLLEYAPPYHIREGKNASGKESFDLWAEGNFDIGVEPARERDAAARFREAQHDEAHRHGTHDVGDWRR